MSKPSSIHSNSRPPFFAKPEETEQILLPSTQPVVEDQALSLYAHLLAGKVEQQFSAVSLSGQRLRTEGARAFEQLQMVSTPVKTKNDDLQQLKASVSGSSLPPILSFSERKMNMEERKARMVQCKQTEDPSLFQSQCVQQEAEKRNLGEHFRQTESFRGSSIPPVTQPEPQPLKTDRELLAEGVKTTKKKADTSLAASIQAMNAMKVRENMVRADIIATALRGIATVLADSPVEQVCRIASKVGRRPGQNSDKETLKTSESVTKPHAFINRLKELGISEQETNQYLTDSQLITKTAAATLAGLGAIRLGSQALPAITTKVSNLITRFTTKNPPPLPKGPRTIVLERTSTTTPAPFNPMRETVAEFEEHTVVGFEYKRLSETTSIAYVKHIQDTNNSGTALNTINRLKQLAEQHGSSDLILQAIVQNDRLLNILKTRYTYLGKRANNFYSTRGDIYDTFLVPLK